jgi:hypothetical protein
MLHEGDFHSPRYVGPERGHVLEIFHLQNGAVIDKGITQKSRILPWAEEKPPPDAVGGIRLV